MAMSKDRIKFTIPEHRISKSRYSRDSDKMRDVVEKAFGECLGRCDWEGGVTIICRPSQFARFLILRNAAGLANGFKELSPELFVPKPKIQSVIFDVSQNDNKVKAPEEK